MPKRSANSTEKIQEIMHQLTLAEQGDAAAQNAVGAKLAQGYFVKRDLKGALYWYSQAVRQGYTHAKWNAGSMLIAGEGVSAAYIDLGMRLIEDAADAGDASACNFLAYCYGEGSFGKNKDKVASVKWAGRAMDHEDFVEYGRPINIEEHGIQLSKPLIEPKA